MSISERYFTIIFRLMRGDKLTTKALAEEFGVSVRAIQHDLNERLPAELMSHLIVDENVYYLDPLTITSFFPEHIQKILSLINSEDVLPHKFTKQSLETLLSYNKDNAPFHIQPARRASLDDHNKQIHAILEKAIKQSSHISFVYKKKGSDKHYQHIEPYRLIDHQGIWYLAAVDNKKIKTFVLTNISGLIVSKQHFERQQKIIELINQDESIWLSESKFPIKLIINSEYAEYFTRRNVIPNQTHQMNPDKTITVQAEVTDLNEILPILRYWLPAIEHIEPEALKARLMEDLEIFKNKLKNFS